MVYLKNPARPKKRSAPGRSTGEFTQHRKLEELLRRLERYPSGLPIAALARDLGLSTRSVRRYLDELVRVNGTIESIAPIPGGPKLWRVKPTERAKTTNVRRTQAIGLHATRSVFDVLSGTAMHDELEVIYGELLQIATRPPVRSQRTADPIDLAQLERRFQVISAPSRILRARAEIFDLLLDASIQFRVLQLRVAERSERNEPERTTRFHPYGMILRDGEVFAVGFDTLQASNTVLSLDRILDARPLEGTFVLPEGFALESYNHGIFGLLAPRERSFRVLFEVSHKRASSLKGARFHPTQRVAFSGDGRMRVSFLVPELEPVVRWVLSQGADVEVIQPKELRNAVALQAAKLHEKYSRELSP